MHDGERVLGVGLRALLVAEDAEGHDDGVGRAVLALHGVEDRGVGGDVVGVELHRHDLDGSGRADGAGLVGEVVGAPGGEDDGGRPAVGHETPGEGDADLTAAAEDEDDLALDEEDDDLVAVEG